MAKKGIIANESFPNLPSFPPQLQAANLLARLGLIGKSRIISVRLISMAMTGYFYQFSRPRTSIPMSMLKYDPIGTRSAPNNVPPPPLSVITS